MSQINNFLYNKKNIRVRKIIFFDVFLYQKTKNELKNGKRKVELHAQEKELINRNR